MHSLFTCIFAEVGMKTYAVERIISSQRTVNKAMPIKMSYISHSLIQNVGLDERELCWLALIA